MMCRRFARSPHKPGEHVFLNCWGRPYTKDSLVTKMDRIRERAGIAVKGGERIVLYSARHTYGTEAVGRVSDIELAELMGHTEARMTQRYVHLKSSIFRTSSVVSERPIEFREMPQGGRPGIAPPSPLSCSSPRGLARSGRRGPSLSHGHAGDRDK
jgi:hypothetical protein